MYFFGCYECGGVWPVKPVLFFDGSHQSDDGARCHGSVESYVPSSKAYPSAERLIAAEARTERAIGECERLASQALIAQVQLRQAMKGAERHSKRNQDLRVRTQMAESAIQASKRTPMTMVRSLTRVEKLLTYLAGRDPCPSCLLRHAHRKRCRIITMLNNIATVLDVQRRPPKRIERVQHIHGKKRA